GRVLDFAEADLVLQSIDQLHIADGAGQLAYQAGHSLIALATHAYRPGGRTPLAWSVGPLLADLAQVVGKDEGGAAAIGAVNDDDLLVGQFDAGVVLGDAAVVPVGYLAQIDVGQHIAAEFEVVDAGDVEDRHHRAKHCGNVNQL